MNFKEVIDRYQVAMNTIYREVNNLLKESVHADITSDQFTTLQYIYYHNNCTSTQIAKEFGIGKSAVTAQINRLFDKQLIRRQRDERDRRMVYLFITKQGEKLVKYTEEKLYTIINEKLSHFDENEVKAFVTSIERLAELMKE